MAATMPQENMRGLWVVRHSITSPQQIDELLQDASRWGITDLFVQVRGRGDAYYRSRLEPRAPGISDSLFDPLGYLLQQNQHRKIRIHTWINLFYVWSSDSLPADSNHVVRRHPEWLAGPLEDPDFLAHYPASMKKANSEGLFLSPLHPRAQQYLKSVVGDLLQQYAVDGLHLDYIRYPNRNFDLNSLSRAGYRQRYILDPLEFLREPAHFAEAYGITGYEVFSGQWNRYLRDGLSEFVGELCSDVRRQFPDVLISAAVKPEFPAARWEFYQDWPRWLQSGWLDFAVPMNYTPDNAVFKSRLRSYLDRLQPKNYLVGLALYNQPPEKSIPKIAQVASLEQSTGFVLFSYSQLKQQPKVMRFLEYQGNRPENNSK
ncbi:MAG: family 10 glycosylhydrolase [Calditrichia bacterium]